MSKIVKAAIAGCGGVSNLYTQGILANPDKIEVVACCDLFEENAQTRAKAVGAKRTYTDYEKLLRDPEVELVIVTSWSWEHARMSIAALEAGKHVWVEKPMGESVQECEAMIAAAEKAGVQLHQMESYVYYPPHERLKQALDDGELGDPVSVQMKVSTWSALQNPPRPIGGWLESPLMVHPPVKRPDREEIQKKRETPQGLRSGGASLMGWGVHQIASVYALLGDWEKAYAMIIGDEFKAVDLLGNTFTSLKDSFYWVTWKCRDSAVHGMYEHNPKGPLWDDCQITLTGTKAVGWVTGALERVIAGGSGLSPLVVYSENETKYYCTGKKYAESVHEMEPTWKKMIGHHADCLIKNTKPFWTAQDGRRMIEIIQALYRSAMEGTEQQI